MSTHPIGAGTCNLSVNVRLGVRAALGRFACVLDVSTGELCRRLLAAGAHIARAFLLARRERRQARILVARLRGILASGQAAEQEVVQLRTECLPIAEEIATDARAITNELKLAEVKP